METFVQILIAAMEVFNWYGLQHVRYNKKIKCFELLDRIAYGQDSFIRVITSEES
jgi:hypothetical protein